MGGYSEKNQEAVMDDGEMDAGQADTMDVHRALLLTSPRLHLPLETQLTETIGTELANDLWSNPRKFFSLHLQFLTPLTSISLLKKSFLPWLLHNESSQNLASQNNKHLISYSFCRSGIHQLRGMVSSEGPGYMCVGIAWHRFSRDE